ncbi:MAG: hypothetical protein KGJ69_15970 [Thermoplasmata archaeon]|nr:hypothetical protein [Thermoplasmata archaeon]
MRPRILPRPTLRRTASVSLGFSAVLWTMAALVGTPVGNPTLVSQPSGASVAAHSANAPSLQILSPTNGANISGGRPVVVSFYVLDFNLTSAVGDPDQPGQGHVNVSADGTFLEFVTNEAPLSLWLADGPHDIQLELVSNMGRPLSPPVTAMVAVAVTHAWDTGDSPFVNIWSPSTGSTVNGPVVTISFLVWDFTIVPPTGQPNAPNEGHLHLWVDGAFYAMITAPQAIQVTGLATGTHTVKLLLVNNDHSPYLVNGTAKAWATSTFTVTGATGLDPALLSTLELVALATLGTSSAALVVAIFSARRSRASPARSPPSASTPRTSGPEEADEEETPE